MDHDYPFEDLVREPCFTSDDLASIRLEEPDLWRRFASTLEHSLAWANLELPLLEVRRHTETFRGKEVVFCLLAMRPSAEGSHVLFGEVAMTQEAYRRHVKEFGLCAPVPRRAAPVDPTDPTPAQIDDFHWGELLRRQRDFPDEVD